MVDLYYFHTHSLKTKQANVIQVLEMCQAFAEIPINVTLFLPDHDLTYDTINTMIQSKIGANRLLFRVQTYKPCHIFNKLKHSLTFLNFWKCSFKNKNAVIFIRFPVLMAALGTIKRRYVYEAHGVLQNSFIDRLIRRIILGHLKAQRIPLMVCISGALKNWYVSRGFPPDKLMVLHDGVNPELFVPPDTAEDWKNRLGLPVGKQILTYAGSLYLERKIEVILKCARECPDLHFIIIGGNPPEVDGLREACRSGNIANVILTGYLDRKKMIEYLWASDYLLMLWSSDVSTIKFCSPLKMFEFMSTRRVIIGYAFPTILEVLENGKDAFLVEPDSFTSLLATIREVTGKEYPSIVAETAFKKVTSKYSWDNRAKCIYQGIMDHAVSSH